MKRIFGIIVLGLVLASCGSDSSSSGGVSSNAGSNGSLGSDNACIQVVASYVANQMQYNDTSEYTLTYSVKDVEFNDRCNYYRNCNSRTQSNEVVQQDFTDASYALEDIVNTADECTISGSDIKIRSNNTFFVIKTSNPLAANPIYIESWSGNVGDEGTVRTKNLSSVRGGYYNYNNYQYNLSDLFKKWF